MYLDKWNRQGHRRSDLDFNINDMSGELGLITSFLPE